MTISPAPIDGLSHLTAVCLLESYSKAMEKGRNDLKSALWSLNKARRQKGQGSISSMDVREELRARTVLREATPDLLADEDKDDAVDTFASSDHEDHFRLVDAVEERKSTCARNEHPEDSTNSKSKASASDGLRNRKGADAPNIQTEGEWTEEIESNPDEEDRLRNADPIELFGALAPRDLKLAQEGAKKALAAYVEAANLAVAILNATRKDSK